MNKTYSYDQTDTRVVHRRVLEEVGGKPHHITQAAPNELKLDEGG